MSTLLSAMSRCRGALFQASMSIIATLYAFPDSHKEAFHFVDIGKLVSSSGQTLYLNRLLRLTRTGHCNRAVFRCYRPRRTWRTLLTADLCIQF